MHRRESLNITHEILMVGSDGTLADAA
jgi:hypothetical protein